MVDSSSANSVNDWLESQIHQQVAIWCEDPEVNVEKIAGGVLEKTYLTYRILYKQIGRDLIAVRHRYSEFESLRTDLRDRYHPLGILVPSLPPKNSFASLNSMANKNPDETLFVKERTLGLSLFCENVVASPWLRNDPQWKTFCRPSGGAFSADESSTANQAETQLAACLKQLELPYKFTMTQRIEDIKEEIKSMEGHAKFLLERSRAVQNAEKQMQAANEQLKRGLEGWFDAERIHVKSLGGRVFDEHDPVIKQSESLITSVVGFNGVVTARRNAENDAPAHIGLTLVALFEHELAKIESFKELFKVHDEMVKDIDSCSNKITKLENSKNAKFDQIQDLRRQLDDKQSCLNAFYKGFIYFTIPIMARQRAFYARRFFSGFIASQMSNAFTLFKASQEFFAHLILPIQQVAEETSRTLELLNVKPIAKLPYDEIDAIFSNNGEQGAKQPSGESSPVNSGSEKRLSTLKSSNIFMSYESDGLNGLFDRALVLSKKKPIEKTQTNAAAITTHLFTSSIAPLNAPNNNNLPVPPPPAASSSSSEPAVNSAVSSQAPPSANPLARRGSAVTRSAEKEKETVLPRFVEGGDTSNNRLESDFQEVPVTSSMSDLTLKEEVYTKPSDKSKNILDSLLGGGSSSPADGSKSPVATKSENRTSTRRNQSIWDDA